MRAGLTLLLVLGACRADEASAPTGGGDPAIPSAPPGPFTFRSISPNAFYAGGTPTYIAGTAGDERADRDLRTQIELVRQSLFPAAVVLEDHAVIGASWPERPVVYGGPQVNALMRELAPGLPFALDAERLEIGGQSLADVQLITVLPARAAAPAHPELLLYAGTGVPGVTEINGVKHGPAPLLIADAFGPLYTGRWVAAADGSVTAELGEPARRIAWREEARRFASYRFPRQIAAADNEAALIAAAERGVERAVTRLGLTDPTARERPVTMVFYVYPDVRSKQTLTGDAGDGHAIVAQRVLHIVGRDDVAGIESLVAHEATHVLVHHAFGAAGTALVGEGLAVWVSGRYAGISLGEWRSRLTEHPSVRELLGRAFRQTPERVSYPVAGLVVNRAVELVGLDAVMKQLLGATAETWDAACKAAGIDPAALARID